MTGTAPEPGPGGALAGIRVLDLTRYVAGPHATQIMGDFGADVVKVESLPGGDGTRYADTNAGAPDSMFWMTINRSKRSLALDLRSPEGLEVLTELVKSADVLIENFRPGVLEKMGFAWPRLQTLNPRLILARVSGFGQDGPWAGRASYDPVIQALSGIMELTGQPDGPPTVCGTIITDYLTALHAVIGVVTALQARERSGKGQWVDVSMLDGATSLLMTAIPEYLMLGRQRTRRGNKNPISVPSHSFECSDGRYVHLTAWTDGEFAKLSTAMAMPDLPRDPRFVDVASRRANDRAIETIVAGWMLQRDSVAAEDILLAHGLPAARVATIAEMVDSPQMKHRGHIRDVEHPLQGKIPVAGPAIRFSEHPIPERLETPVLGQHSAEVLRDWLGLDDAAIDALSAAGTVETGPPESARTT
ncbi:MAG: CoA transferase [Minwuia sp.]|nr:CoA transferase [Minwuia sp.]